MKLFTKKDLTILMPMHLAGYMFLRVTQTVMTVNQGKQKKKNRRYFRKCMINRLEVI